MERTERIETIVILSSTGGGTGSGIGSKILEMIRVEYPRVNIF